MVNGINKNRPQKFLTRNAVPAPRANGRFFVISAAQKSLLRAIR